MIKNLFLIYIFFFSVSLFNTSDLNLFLEDEIYFFYMPISLHFFYFVSPIVLFFLHYLYLKEFLLKEKHLQKSYVFGLYSKFIEKTLLFLEVIIPLLLLLILQIKLSKFQELGFTYFHYFIFLVELSLLFVFLSKIYRKENISKIQELYYRKKFFLFLSLLFFVFICSTYNFYLINSILLSQPNLPVESYKFNTLLSKINFLLNKDDDYSFLFPRLNLEGLDLSVEKNKFSSGRNFKYANFQNSTLRISSLNKANTEFANFTGVRWIGE